MRTTVAVALASTAFCASPPFPPPPFDDHFPALYFGANASGLESTAQLAFDARHALAGYGWQQNSAAANYTHGEASLAAAAAALARLPNAPPVFVYRHFQMAWTLFDIQRAADADPSLRGIFLRDHDNAPGAAECRQPTPGNTTSPLLAFKNSSAGVFWVSRVVGELAREEHIRAAFFDECDWSACGYSFAKDGCANISDAFRADDLIAKYAALRGTVDALNDAGVYPILSAKNLLVDAWVGLPANATRPCVIPHDGFVRALEGSTYSRFYEFFMGSGKEIDTATITNVLLEGAQGIGLVARGAADAASCPGQVCPDAPGRTTTLSYSLAAFMVARTSAYSYFGFSNGWHSACWCWHDEYDAAAACGAPMAAAVRESLFVWTRAYAACDVRVDTEAAEGSIVPR